MLAVVKQAYSGVRTCRHIVVVSAVRSGLPVSTRSLDYKPLESTKHALSLFCFLGRRFREQLLCPRLCAQLWGFTAPAPRRSQTSGRDRQVFTEQDEEAQGGWRSLARHPNPRLRGRVAISQGEVEEGRPTLGRGWGVWPVC